MGSLSMVVTVTRCQIDLGNIYSRMGHNAAIESSSPERCRANFHPLQPPPVQDFFHFSYRGMPLANPFLYAVSTVLKGRVFRLGFKSSNNTPKQCCLRFRQILRQ